jgi:hypothetical protein
MYTDEKAWASDGLDFTLNKGGQPYKGAHDVLSRIAVETPQLQ